MTSSSSTSSSLLLSEIYIAVPLFFFLVAWFLCFRKKYPLVYMNNKPDISTPQKRGKKYLLSMHRDDENRSEFGILSFAQVFNSVWKLRADDIIRLAGFDAYSFTYMYWYQFLLMLYLIPVSFIFLIPVYATGNGLSGNTDYVDMMTLSNVGSSSFRIWFTVIVAFILYVGSALFMRRSFREMSLRADAYNSNNQIEGNYTVLITELEEPYTTDESLKNFLNQLFPDQVINVDICKNLSKVQSIWLNLVNATSRRELCQKSRRKAVGYLCCHHDLEECNQKEDRARELFYAINRAELENIMAAIVQFKTMRAAALCANMNLTPQGDYMRAQKVPESAAEILWQNLSRREWSKAVGRNFGTMVYILIIFAFTGIMTTVTALVSLENIALLWSGFADVLTWNTTLTSLLQSAVPSLLYWAFIKLLYYFLRLLSKVSVPDFEYDLIVLTLKRYSDSIIGTGLLVPLFAGSLFSLTSFSVSGLWEVLGVEVPANSVTFIIYVITACFIKMGVELILVTPFIKNVLGLYTPRLFKYDEYFGVAILMFTICTTYAVVSPLILVFGAVYFLFGYIIFTYQLVYVYKKGNEHGGRLTPTVYERLNYGMVIGQLVVAAMLILLNALYQAGLLLIVPFITTYINWNSLKKYGQFFGCSSLATLGESDRKLQQDIKSGIATLPVKLGENSFIAPMLQALRVSESKP